MIAFPASEVNELDVALAELTTSPRSETREGKDARYGSTPELESG
jgi:hypothetical protein